jgi:hypothetical protein
MPDGADTPELPQPTGHTPTPGGSHYGFSFMQAAVMARQEAERAARGPRQELNTYLEAPLQNVEDVLHWWGVSYRFCYSYLISRY